MSINLEGELFVDVISPTQPNRPCPAVPSPTQTNPATSRLTPHTGPHLYPHSQPRHTYPYPHPRAHPTHAHTHVRTHAHLQEGRDGLPVELDHLEVGEAVDAAHVDAHDGEHEPERAEHLAERDDEHAERDQRRRHQQDHVRLSPAETHELRSASLT